MSATNDPERPTGSRWPRWILAVAIEFVVYSVAFGAAVWVMGRLGCLPDPSK